MTSFMFCFFFSSRRRHTRFKCDWSSDVCSSDLPTVHRDLLSLDRRADRGTQGGTRGAPATLRGALRTRGLRLVGAAAAAEWVGLGRRPVAAGGHGVLGWPAAVRDRARDA